MADSLRASDIGLQRIDQARRAKRWHKTAEAWCAATFTSRATLNRFWRGRPIRSETFIAICGAVNVDWETVVDASEFANSNDHIAHTRNTAHLSPIPTVSQTVATLSAAQPSTSDWGDAPETVGFVGREAELQTLSQWLQDENCRLIVLIGLGGIGKTALSVYSARSHAQDFDCVIWQSLRNALAAETVIKACTATLLPQAVSHHNSQTILMAL